jgi:hypothetical protein
MFLSGFCYLVPTSIVLIVAMVIAISRWQRHPRVSATVVTSMACMLLASVGQQLLFAYLYPARTVGPRDVAIYFQVIAAIASLIRAGGWAAILVAIFGWREGAARGKSPLQFSIRGLLVVTFVVAVLCGLVRGVAMLLGESADVLMTLLDDIPVILCWAVGARLAWSRWQLHPQVSKCTLIAIGLACAALIMYFLLAIRMYYTPDWPMALAIIGSLVLGPATWIVLLIAAFGWRTLPAAAPDSVLRESPA